MARPCSADQIHTAMARTRSGGAVLATPSSRKSKAAADARSQRLVVGLTQELGGEHQPVDPAVGARELEISQAGLQERLVLARLVPCGDQAVAEALESVGGDGGEQGVTIGEMPIGRGLRDAQSQR